MRRHSERTDCLLPFPGRLKSGPDCRAKLLEFRLHLADRLPQRLQRDAEDQQVRLAPNHAPADDRDGGDVRLHSSTSGNLGVRLQPFR